MQPFTALEKFMNNPVKIKINGLHFSYGKRAILSNVSTQFNENTLTAIVGPSGMGKSTLLMTLNRLWESIPTAKMQGEVQIKFKGRFHDIYGRSFPVDQLRRLVGMVFQVPNPLPMSIHKNVAFPLKLAGWKDRTHVNQEVEEALRGAHLWDEVKDRLTEDALTLSGGQQQRLCIARALVLKPEILLLDEPTSSLDAKAGAVIEDLLLNLKDSCTLVVVSHYLDQVKRIADSIMDLGNGILTSVGTPDNF
jgi:phosphate transport system ATP-binding protein